MGKKFINPHVLNEKRTFWDVILWKMGIYKDPVTSILPPDPRFYVFQKNKFEQNKPQAVWINHSTFLIHLDGLNILTDPIWSQRCAPLGVMGPKRLHPPSIELDKLPTIDYVLITHNHYDHLDEKTVRFLSKKFSNIRWIVPKNVKKWFDKRKIDHVHELAWWETFLSEKQKVRIHAVPAQHFSGRGPFDHNQTLWAGYIFEKSFLNTTKCFFLSCDTGYNDKDFKEIGRKFPSIDLSLIPIGAYAPRDFMRPVHVNPKEALQIHEDVSSKFSIGMHWKTFNLSDEHLNMPPYDLYLALKEKNIDSSSFVTVQPGQYVNW